MHAWIDMFKPNIIARTMIGVMLMVFQQLQGINAVSLLAYRAVELIC